MSCKDCITYDATTNTQRQPTSPFAQSSDIANFPINPQHADYPMFRQSQGAGHTHVYPQVAGTPSATSDADIWRHLDTWVWGKTGEQGAIKPMIEKHGRDSGERFESLQTQIDAAKAERDSIQSKIGSGGGNGGCEWWDIGCHTAGGFQSIGLLAVLGVVGYVLYKKAT